MNALIQAFSLPIIRNAFIGMVIAGGTLSLLGIIIVSLNLTAIRFTLMHTGLLGAAVSTALAYPPILGAFTLVVLSSVLMASISNKRSISTSSASGLIMTGSLAGAFIILAVSGVPAMHVFDIFAGNILMLTSGDLILVFALGIFILLFFSIAYREVQLVLLDKETARNLGVPVDAIAMIMFILLGVGVATALRLVGALLVDALILLPAIAALRIARNFAIALVLSSAFGMLSSIGGFLIALALDLPVGASTALVSAIILAVSLLFPKTTVNHIE
ncbi:MAG: metal ABC transporter permease [Sphaerochaetaceae bacterium]|jgi:ABC-type Mn2+/Zn2+ transport system permease subunit|nr:metal ABC transporter permease [Sphaerochaetaceae bacterium]MDD4259333.1 metal ABC transporter permease [Sphaerochaetaceae bacterium]MDD4764164.1 metal ABC transporter permease [Sphaerochaetaceae bacterium]NLO60100.1 metal ABC transporter permease [Spirochaetales bacterium]